MSTLRKVSGRVCVRILCNRFGFSIRRRRGSHIMLVKETQQGAVGTVVPDHKELKLPTLKCILKLAKVKEEEFSRYL